MKNIILVLLFISAITVVLINYFPWQRSYMLCDETRYNGKHPQLDLLKRLAAKGDHVAECSLGYAYIRGFADSPPDFAAGYKLIHESAEQGNAAAQRWLGIQDQGTPQGADWLRKAAEQGDISAQFFLAIAYSEGKGVPQSDAEAIKWYMRAAKQEFMPAQMFLAESYRKGTHGLPKDYVQAYVWWRIAIANSEFNQKRITEYEQGMSPEQIVKAKSIAQQWKPEHEPVQHLSIFSACCLKLN